MSQLDTQQWEKELRFLLDRLQAHPSRDATEDRQRIAVLKNLIANPRDKVSA
jgi:hypothetical protein